MKVLRRFNSIRTKLLVISFLILTIPISILGVLSYQQAKNSLNESGIKRLESSVEMTLEMITSFQEEVEKGNLSIEEAQEKVKVAVLGEMDENGHRPINPNIDLGENGYIFILDQKGKLLAHPNNEGENLWEDEDSAGNKYIQDMISAGNAGGNVTYYDWPFINDESRIEPKVTYAKTSPEWDWVVNASTYMIDFNESSNEILLYIYVVTGITLILGIGIIWIFINRITRPMIEVVDQMNVIAQADLSREKLAIHSKDETGQLAEALNSMQEGLRNIIGNVFTASNTIASQSEELTQAAHEVGEGTEQVATTMEELASGAETQANRSEEISTMMGSFVTKLEEANQNGENVREASRDVLTMTEEGSQLMNASTEQMAMIDEIVQDAVSKVEGLDEHSQQISELVAVIQDIAEQTNLLALNAAIEAARAGEHGQGFAVVADEVRKLAEESASSVTHITKIVNQIQEESSVVANSLRTGYEEVEQGSKQIAATDKTFAQINGAMIDMAEQIEQISANLEDIVSNSQEVNAAIEDIAAVSEESAAGIEETTATTEQANATMQEVAASSNNLSILAEELNNLVSEFKL